MAAQAPPFSAALAHEGDLLVDHLARVAAAARHTLLSASAEARAVATVAGLSHDLGKATSYFQAYLTGSDPRSERTHHARLGALFAWWASGALPTWQRLAALVAVLRHHGRLFRPWKEELKELRFAASREPVLRDQLSAMDVEGASTWLRGAIESAGLVPPEPLADPDELVRALPRMVRRGPPDAVFDLDRCVDFLAGFGALVGADRIDTALAGDAIERRAIPADAVTRFRQERFGTPRRALDLRRAAIAATVETTWAAHSEDRLLTLTSPTGSGKTLAVLGAALAARARSTNERPPRIVYCLPFTSVIDQNERVVADVLTNAGLPTSSEWLLKHHHLADRSYRQQTDEGTLEHEEDGAGRLLTESWQSEVVVTTFHQLLHSLLSTRSRDLLRAGTLAGAIVLLDEVQAIPLKYWHAVRALLMAASERLRATFVLLTATRPLILRPGDATELLPDHPDHFGALSRTTLRCHHRQATTLWELADELVAAQGQAEHASLVILNRKKAVRELAATLAERLPGRSVRALSTSLRPLDRLARIREIRAALERGETPIVVSTQLVEAGVDFSFPVVHRDLAPLDSVIQAAGRCNRSGESAGGVVHLWQLVDDGERPRPLWRHVYDRLLIQATEEALGDAPERTESEFLELSQRYFAACDARAAEERVDEWLAAGDFSKLRESFRLIDELPTQSHYVCLNEGDRQIWSSYQEWQLERRGRAFRRLERDFFERVVQTVSRAPSAEVLLVGPDGYDPELGLL